MKKIAIVLSVALLGLFFSCDNSASTNETDEVSKEDTEKAVSETDQQNKTEEIEKEEDTELALNDGEKWKVNPEMIPYIKEGDSLINDFIDKEKEDYQLLGLSLSKVNSNLVASCTLPGDDPNHIALHKWLKPHLEKVKALKGFISNGISKQLFNQVVESYKTFHTYFESAEKE